MYGFVKEIVNSVHVFAAQSVMAVRRRECIVCFDTLTVLSVFHDKDPIKVKYNLQYNDQCNAICCSPSGRPVGQQTAGQRNPLELLHASPQ